MQSNQKLWLETWRIDVDAGLDPSVLAACCADSGESRGVSDRRDARQVELIRQHTVALRTIQPGDLVNCEFQVLPVILHDLYRASELVFGGRRDLTVRKRRPSHVRMIDAEHRVSLAGQLFSKGCVLRTGALPTMRQ